MNLFEVIPDQQTPKVMKEIMSAAYIHANYNLFNDFLNYAKSRDDAAGLAANQCSLNRERFNERIFALRNMETNTWQLIIDPVILEYLGYKTPKLEGCLTWCNRAILAERFPAVRIGYYDIAGQLHDKIYQGFDAQVIQHEYNHIEGIPEVVVETTYKLPPPRKFNRNDKCPCGSGKKYKQCCIIYEEK